jgi:hypothetical protein
MAHPRTESILVVHTRGASFLKPNNDDRPVRTHDNMSARVSVVIYERVLHSKRGVLRRFS